MKVRFSVSAGLHFREVEIVELDDDAEAEYIAEQYNTWVHEQVDGGWDILDRPKEVQGDQPKTNANS